jgi:hypothetical protein
MVFIVFCNILCILCIYEKCANPNKILNPVYFFTAAIDPGTFSDLYETLNQVRTFLYQYQYNKGISTMAKYNCILALNGLS